MEERLVIKITIGVVICAFYIYYFLVAYRDSVSKFRMDSGWNEDVSDVLFIISFINKLFIIIHFAFNVLILICKSTLDLIDPKLYRDSEAKFNMIKLAMSFVALLVYAITFPLY